MLLFLYSTESCWNTLLFSRWMGYIFLVLFVHDTTALPRIWFLHLDQKLVFLLNSQTTNTFKVIKLILNSAYFNYQSLRSIYSCIKPNGLQGSKQISCRSSHLLFWFLWCLIYADETGTYSVIFWITQTLCQRVKRFKFMLSLCSKYLSGEQLPTQLKISLTESKLK